MGWINGLQPLDGDCIPDEDKLNTTVHYEQSVFKCILCQEKH